MQLTTEKENREMYEKGISEWREKCLILSQEEKEEVLRALENEQSSELLDRVKLPFPEFAEEYFLDYPGMTFYLNDPAFGYKLYMMPYRILACFSMYLKNPDIKVDEMTEELGLPTRTNFSDFIMHFMNTPLKDCLAHYESQYHISKEGMRSFIYLTQYIDTKEALRLGLPISQFFLMDGEKGYDLEGKLALLNPVMKELVTKNLGLYGYDRYPASELSRMYGIHKIKLSNAFKILIPVLTSSLGEFKRRIGYSEELNANGDKFILYKDTPYREADFRVEKDYALSNLVNPLEADVLGHAIGQTEVYIAKKYIGLTDEQISRMFIINPDDIYKIVALIESKIKKVENKEVVGEQNTVPITSEEENILMYEKYGISEWREKSIILTEAEKQLIKSYLENGHGSRLVSLVKLPFPEFASNYFRQFPKAKSLYNDKATFYKLYLFSNLELYGFTRFIRDNEIYSSKVFQAKFNLYYNVDTVKKKLHSPFDILNITNEIEAPRAKRIYIAQYVDAAKERELGISLTGKYDSDGVPIGCELNKKMKLLNPTFRTCFSEYVGFCGRDRKTHKYIADKYRVPLSKLSRMINYFIDYLQLSYDEFLEKTGVKENENGSIFEYCNDSLWNRLNIELEAEYYLNNIATDEERKVLRDLPKNDMYVHIAKKYFKWSDKQIERNFITSKKASVSATFNDAITVYQKYGIAEWKEKTLILSLKEREDILRDLESGNETPLVSKVRLPFPKFAREYFSFYKAAEEYVKDYSFGYKLYLLKDLDLAVLSEKLKNPNFTTEYICKRLDISPSSYDDFKVKTMLSLPFSDSLYFDSKIFSVDETSKKFAYLTQYIDLEEARKLGLSIGNSFGIDEGGYNFQAKMNLLNPFMQEILENFLGLYGKERISILQISKCVGCQPDMLSRLFGILFPSFIGTKEAFEHKIGYYKRPESTGFNEYPGNGQFRDIDVHLECKDIINNKLGELDREILKGFSNKEIKIYVAMKYFGWTNRQVIDNLLVNLHEIKKVEEKVKKLSQVE